MCKGCGKNPIYKASMCKGCHAMPPPTLKKGMQPAVGAMIPNANPKMKVPKQKKGNVLPAPAKTMGRNIALSETAQETNMDNVKKSDTQGVPTFPRVTGDSRVLLQHINPDQTVINQITGRDTHQPHSYGLAPSNWEDGNGLRRR
jgi:hypothetical protein